MWWGCSVVFLASAIMLGSSLFLWTSFGTSYTKLNVYFELPTSAFDFYILPPGISRQLHTDQLCWSGRPGVEKSGARATPGMWVK